MFSEGSVQDTSTLAHFVFMEPGLCTGALSYWNIFLLNFNTIPASLAMLKSRTGYSYSKVKLNKLFQMRFSFQEFGFT